MIHFVIEGALFVMILFVASRVDHVAVRMRSIGGEVSELWDSVFGGR